MLPMAIAEAKSIRQDRRVAELLRIFEPLKVNITGDVTAHRDKMDIGMRTRLEWNEAMDLFICTYGDEKDTRPLTGVTEAPDMQDEMSKFSLGERVAYRATQELHESPGATWKNVEIGSLELPSERLLEQLDEWVKDSPNSMADVREYITNLWRACSFRFESGKLRVQYNNLHLYSTPSGIQYGGYVVKKYEVIGSNVVMKREEYSTDQQSSPDSVLLVVAPESGPGIVVSSEPSKEKITRN